MHPAALILALLIQDGTVLTNPEGNDLRIKGSLDLHYAFFDGLLEEGRNRLNGAPASADDDNLFSGEFSLGLDLQWNEDLRGEIDLRSHPFEDGSTIPLSDQETHLNLYEFWIEGNHVLSDLLKIRIGIQHLRLSNRYDDEAFFLDTESESAWIGQTPTGTVVTADRDISEPAGIRLWYDAAIFLKLQAFAFVIDDDVSPSESEMLYGFYASAQTSEVLTVKFLTTLFSGPEHNSSVWTAGLSLVHAPHQNWLFAGEVYSQFGKAMRSLDKHAWATDLSARYNEAEWWAEVGYTFASGEDPNDPDDEGWQSYENVNRFVILQSAEFGWDWDTNYQLLRGALEHRWRNRCAVRLDLGWFSLPEAISGIVNQSEDQLGIEVDGTVEVPVNNATRATFQGAWLTGSDVLEQTTADQKENTWVLILGLNLIF